MKTELQMHWILQRKPAATQTHQRNWPAAAAAAAVQQVAVVVAVVVKYQMLQILAVPVEQVETPSIQMGQMYSEQGLPVVLQMHWMKQSHLAVAEIRTGLEMNDAE